MFIPGTRYSLYLVSDKIGAPSFRFGSSSQIAKLCGHTRSVRQELKKN